MKLLRTSGVHVMMTALIFLPLAAGAASFNYLYIEASEGNSSGGHTAIQFNDEIYHFQHLDSGLIRLFRRENAEFHFLYRYLQNRPIHESRVDVSDDTFEMLKGQFKWQYLTQESQFKLLDELHKDKVFISRLRQLLTVGHAAIDAEAASVMRLKGAGLFYPESGPLHLQTGSHLTKQQTLSIQSLRKKVEQRYGLDFLLRRRKQIESQIKTLAPNQWPDLTESSAVEKIPSTIYSFTERYSDYLTGLFAIKALVEAPPLQTAALLLRNQQDFKISEAERRVLQAFRHDLETSLIKAIDSNRPDWGYAVLVNIARYIAIDATLQSGYWVFLDDFTENSEWVKPDDYLQNSAQMRYLIADARAALTQIRQTAATRQLWTEAEYSQIEMAANRYLELLKSEQYRDIRYNGEKPLPSKSIGFPEGPVPTLTSEQLTTALSGLENIERSLFQKLKQDYRYDLINRNCVTELFRTINQALLTDYVSKDILLDPDALVVKESEKRLGGYVDTTYNFIPFVSYEAVRNRYHVTMSRDLDSYRRLELAKLNFRQNNLITALRESNIVSSQLYKYNPDDALFMFFTDDNLLLRPLFGAVNTIAGIGQSVYGFFSWPLDSGKNLQSGATGILMSLPEMLFFNMRKGSYKFLSYRQLIHGDSPDD
jgi:hypothetical protein